MSVQPAPVFNFRVLFSPPTAEIPALESGDAQLAAGALGSGVVASSRRSNINLGFAEIGGLNSEIEMEEYREGGRNIGPRRFPKWGRYPNLVMRRGLTTDQALWDWWADVITRSFTLTQSVPPPRRSGLILLDDRNHTAVAAWFFSNALPERLIGPGLNARSNEIAIETLELSHEGLLRLASVPQGV